MSQRSEVPSHLRPDALKATEKQKAFMRSLLEQLGRTESDLGKPLDSYGMREASFEIEGLLLEKKQVGHSRSSQPIKNLPATIHGRQVPQGTYTVVFAAGENGLGPEHRITIKFREPKQGKWVGYQLVSYLAGPDNEHDYVRCANYVKSSEDDIGYRVWNRFKENGIIANAIKSLMGDEEARQAAGYLYSLESSNCYRCGRTLTVPASIHRGLGPECAGIIANGGR